MLEAQRHTDRGEGPVTVSSEQDGLRVPREVTSGDHEAR
jgi:hypothetical protein